MLLLLVLLLLMLLLMAVQLLARCLMHPTHAVLKWKRGTVEVRVPTPM